MPQPILYTFRRCPYAIRARMALRYSQINYQHREVILKHKPQAMLDLSAKATVPILQVDDKLVLDESVDIMHWALARADPENWVGSGLQSELVARNDSYFKYYLDRYKYFDRHPEYNQQYYLGMALVFLSELEARLGLQKRYLDGDKISWVDMAIFPFVRQFAMVDKVVFSELALPNLQNWLNIFLKSQIFTRVMQKYPAWQAAPAQYHYTKTKSNTL